jgi:thiamine-phosphate pyrophosphorylase
MVVTDRHAAAGRDLIEIVSRATEGGIRLIQVREKDLDDEPLADLVGRILEHVPAETRVIVNGRVAVARATGCGLHLPAIAPATDRSGIPLVGRSAHDLDESRRALRESVDYLVAGPVFPTASKPGHPGAGVALVRSLASAVAPLPLFAIGGVERSRVTELLEAGAYGVAVCRAVLAAPDPCRAARELIEATAG